MRIEEIEDGGEVAEELQDPQTGANSSEKDDKGTEDKDPAQDPEK